MSLRLAFAFTFALASPVLAQNMTDAERADFRAEVRAYLLENPEVLMEAIGVLEQRQAEAELQSDLQIVQSNAAAIFDDGFSYVGGNPEGDVTVVEFMDYKCGYCKRAHPEVAALIAGDPNIRYVLKEFPILGEQSDLAARYAIAVQLIAGDEVYYDVHNTLMEFSGDISPASLAQISEAFGLDNAAILARMDSDEITAMLTANRDLAQRLQITGTPSFIFGEQMLRGYVPLPQMEAIVDQLRSDNG